MANGFFDSAIALRILYLLVQPIEKLPAFKLGLVGSNGEILRKPKTPEEKAATSMLLRLVLRIRNFLSMIPLAQSKLGSYVSAYALVRECIRQDNYLPTIGQLDEIDQSLDLSTVDTEYLAEHLALFEDGIANVTGTGTSTDQAAIKPRKNKFKVSKNTFNNFEDGKTRSRRVGLKLDLNDSVDQELYKYVYENKNCSVILECDDAVKLVSYIKGEPEYKGEPLTGRQVLESYIDDMEYTIKVTTLC